jgi:hypothetical protein
MSDTVNGPGKIKLLPKANFATIRRMLAAIVATQTFCALGWGRAASNTHGYILLLAIVFTPATLVWCNARPRLINRVLEVFGWALLLFLCVIAVGSM